MERVWIDWNQALLPAAAEWLLEQGAPRGALIDLRSWCCVLPGRRAGRILLTNLAQQADALGRAFIPPDVLTPGSLAQSVLDVQGVPASPHERVFAWVMALREMDPRELEPLLPSVPADDDVLAWHELARTFDGLYVELGGGAVRLEEVPDRAATLELFAEGERWHVLARVARSMHETLSAASLTDPVEAQRTALQRGEVSAPSKLILIGVTDLIELHRRVIAHVDAASPSWALVHAPEAHVDRFDALGCATTAGWSEQSVPIDDDMMTVAQEPSDQAQVALEFLHTLNGNHAPDEITFGLCDDHLAPVVERAARQAGLNVHHASGRALRTTGPWRLLAACADWVSDTRFANLAALLRHPDIEHWLRRQCEIDITSWLTLLDEYFSDHLHARLSGAWLGRAATRDRLNNLWTSIARLTAPFTGSARTMADWGHEITQLLAEVYGDLPAAGGDGFESRTVHACLALRRAAEDLVRVHPGLQPSLDAASAIRLLLTESADAAVASEVRAGQIDMLGWLELHTDPAPVLIMLGVNDGAVPESVTSDPFLPDSLRQALGLMHNQRRAARDAYLMTAMAHARPVIHAIAGRVDGAGNPLLPSRLLLACDDEELPARVLRMCGGSNVYRRVVPMGAPAGADVSAFTIPELPEIPPPPESMRVTEFRAYLACPYRYALQRLMGLRGLSDEGDELDALQFGTLAHAVLQTFGENTALRDSKDAVEIESALSASLDEHADRRYGRAPIPAVQLQIARLRERMAVFAELQVSLRCEGWVIRHSEYALPEESTLDLPGERPMPLRGKIDRIDQHEHTGTWRIIDYKTGEKGTSPAKAHHGRERPPAVVEELEWNDLQLPLYHYLAAQHGFTGDVELAYLVLPGKAEDTQIRVAPWGPEHLEHAVETARQVVRCIRAGEYPRRDDVPESYDAFARLCQSNAFGLRVAGSDEEGGSA